MKKLILFFIVLSIGFIFSSDKTFAAYSDLPTYLPEKVDPADTGGQYINLAMGGNDPGTGYGAEFRSNQFIVYGKDSEPQRVYFGIANRRLGAAACSGYAINYTVWSINGAGAVTGLGGLGTVGISNCTIGPGYGNNNQAYWIDIGRDVLKLSDRPEDEGSYKAKLELTIVSTDGQPVHSATFRPNIDINRGRLGYARGTNYAVYPSLDQSFGNTLAMRFRQPCNQAVNGQPLRWLDDDYIDPSPRPPGSPDGDGNGTVSQYDSPRARVYEYLNLSRTGSNGGQRSTSYGNAGWGQTIVDLRASHSYELLMESVDGGNGIMFQQPFDSGDFYFQCIDWRVNSLVTSTAFPWVELGTSVDFNHFVNTTSTTGSNPVFTTRQANLDYPPTNSANRAGAFPLGNQTVGDNELKTKLIGADLGELNKRYCQSYTVSPSAVVQGISNNTPITSNPPACSTVVGGKTSPIVQASTTQLIEGGEPLSFTAGVNTSNYTTSGGWTGYSVACTWKLTRQVPGDIPRDIAGQTGDCNNTITADGNGPTIKTIPYIAPATEPIGTYICVVAQITSATSTPRAVSNPAFIGNPNSTPACNIVTAKPFVRAYQGDVVTGGHFGETGAVGSGKVDGYFRGTHAGSGSEFALIAAGTVGSISTSNGFASAFMRDLVSGTKPLPKDGLTFANNVGYDGTAGLGKYYESASRTVEDFYVTTREIKTTDKEIQDLAGNIIDQTKINNPDTVIGEAVKNNGQSWYKPASGTMVTIDNASDLVINKSKKHTIYIDGDVLINQDITYQDGYANKDEIPYFSLIVKGNIFISSGVSRLDGRFIAQPKGVNNNDTTSGFIYTCTTPGTGVRYADNLLYNACQTKLTVNGTMTAQKIKFLRTNGTLRDIKYTPFDPGGAGYVAGIPSTDRLEFTNWGTSLQDAKDDTGKSNCYQIKEVAGTKDARVPGPGNWDGWGTWHDNYLCSDTPLNLVFHDGGQFNGTPDGSTERCSNAWGIGASDGGRNPLENQAPASQYWNDNFLCAPIAMEDIGLQFITGDTIPPGKDCELIAEPSDSQFTADMKRKICWNVLVPGSDSTPEKYEQLKYNTNGEAAGRKITAEEFRLTPEFLIGDPAFKPKPNGDPLNGRYDSIVTLPPIL